MNAAAAPAVLAAAVLVPVVLAMPARARAVWPVWQRMYDGRRG